MDWISIFGIAVALAMDAFAVALAAGTVLDPLTGRHLFRFGFHFGLFQLLMPVIGWLAGLSIQQWISTYNHWIAFALLATVGGRMIWAALTEEEEEEKAPTDPTRGLTMVMLAVATSIDALAVGLSLAMLKVAIWRPAVVIGLVAGVLTVIGMKLGRRLGEMWGKRVEVCGGLILCAIGVKILLENTIFK
ncbi:manganese efflux pump MntP family protein [Geomonas sp. RF6]|uniref:manganese efflux pump MntP n=1 Tax=Geomonas sp. RF6 TaxID=2897342 RepID=UPI001E421FA5|nr:manganese efflux pump MntP family protein [Geomonas sp. RF6]UFS71485.1 manganese efflux pump MntP family protein [Geomonas sp. RF6]